MRLRTSVLLALASLLALLVVPLSTSTSAGAYPVSTCSTLSISTTRPTRGQAVTISGSGFLPNVPVRLVLDTGQTLATATTNSKGAFSISVKLPFSLKKGRHTIVAASGAVRLQSCPIDPVMSFGVQGLGIFRGHGHGHGQGQGGGHGGRGGHGGLSFTGVDILGMLALAAALILAGSMLNGRRRPKARARS